MWGLPEQLLAGAVDALHFLQWSKTTDGAKGRNRPKPIPRPGVTPDETEERQIGSQPVTLDELDDFLQWNREISGDAPLADEPRRLPPRDSRGRFIKS